MNATLANQTPIAAADPQSALPFGLKLGWASGALGVSVLMNGVSGLILLFAASILGIDPWLAGIVIFVSKLVDVVTDPIVGVWSDNHRGGRGRRRPFMLWGAFLSAISFAAIFGAPIFDSQYLTAAYLFLALCLYAFGYTLYNIPYMAMPAEMTDSYHERSSIHAYRIVFVAIGAMVGGAGINLALERLGKTEAQSFAIIGVVCAVLILASLLTAWATTARARFTLGTDSVHQSGAAQVVSEYRVVTRNRNFMRLISVKFAQLIGVQTMGAAIAYFFVQYLQRDFDALAAFGIVSTISTIVFAPLLVRFSRKFGKKNAYYLAAGFNILFAISWTVSGPEEPFWAILMRAGIVGIAFAGNVVMAMSMLTDIINADANRSGVRREGAFTALYSFVEKLTGAVGPLIVGVALSFAGFDKDLPFDTPQGGNVDTALLLAVAWLPALFNIIAVLLLSGYKLTEHDIASKS